MKEALKNNLYTTILRFSLQILQYIKQFTGIMKFRLCQSRESSIAYFNVYSYTDLRAACFNCSLLSSVATTKMSDILEKFEPRPGD